MALLEVTSQSADGFADLSLTLLSFQRGPDGITTLQAAGTHDGRRVGFAITLKATWQPQMVPETTVSVHWGKVALTSVGTESDEFVRVLDEVYRTRTGSAKMSKQVSFNAVCLAGNPLRLKDGPLRIKLFFESDDDDRYAQFYLNIDTAASIVEFHEKDTRFRRAVVLCLTFSAPS